MLLEAIGNMLKDKASLGLHQYAKSEEQKDFEKLPPSQYEYVENVFRLKINTPKIKSYESVSGAFYHTHSYKDLFHPTFNESFNHQMVNMIVPDDERKFALDVVNQLRKEISGVDCEQVCNTHPAIVTTRKDIGRGRVDMEKMREATNAGVE
jgi:hypothetical protein